MCTVLQAKATSNLKNADVPVAVATVPKVLNATRVVFYTNGEKVMSKAIDFKDDNIN